MKVQQFASRVRVLLLMVVYSSAANTTLNTTGDEAPKGSEALSAPVSLFNTLLASLTAVLIGFLAVRLQVIVPERGDLRGFGFFIGQISYPLLVFKTVATAKFGNLDVGTLAACTIGKVVVMAATWLAAWVAYKPRRSQGQRVLSATIFSFFAVASNDFALGFPVIDALYGKTFNMGIYITGNALVTSAVFVPLSMVLLGIGSSMDAEKKDEEEEMSRCMQILVAGRNILLNPVIFMTLLALLYQSLLSDSLVQDGGKLRFPHPLSDLVDLITQPFGMCALFLTGTSLQTPRLSLIPIFLVAMKVVVCAYVTFFFAGLLVGSSMGTSARDMLRNFSFLYGMIPASSAPLIFANQFDPSESEQIATAILLGLVVAGPMMFVASMFLDGGDLDPVAILAKTEYTTIALSLMCGIGILLLLALLRRRWGYQCPSKSLLACYATMLILYEAVALTVNPNLGGACTDFIENPWNPSRLALGWLQQASQLIILVLQVLMVVDASKVQRVPGMLMALLALALSTAAGLLTIPNTFTEMCHVQREDREGVLPNLVWSTALLLATVGLILYGNLRARRSRSMKPEAPAEVQDPEALSMDCHEDEDEDDADGWTQGPPKSVIRSLVGLQAIRFFMQVINSSMVLGKIEVEGGFAEMLVLEALLQHSQLFALVVLLLADQHFGKQLKTCCKELAPWLFDRDGSELGREMSVSARKSQMVRRLSTTAY